MPDMKPFSTASLEAGARIRVNGVCKLLQANLKSIMEYIEVAPKRGDVPAKFLSQFVTESFELKVDEILTTLNISFDALNKDKLIRIWKFMISQSKTCLQGTSFYAFNEFVSLLKSREDFDTKKFWENLCINICTIFTQRKSDAFDAEGKFFSLRMISTNVRLENSNLQDHQNLISNSIDNHFYYFGEENDKAVLPFDFKNKNLILNDQVYRLRSHFLKFEKDSFTSFALWYNMVVDETETVAMIVKKNASSLLGIFPEAESNDYRSQEVMSYWALANSSHQSFHGQTKGVDFIRHVLRTLQIPIANGLNNILPSLNENLIPINLVTFLNSLSIPFLIPERPSAEFKSSLGGLCELGLIYRCPNETGMDIGFEVLKNGQPCYAYVECKYRKVAQGSKDISKYIANAKAKNSVLTLFVSNTIHDDLKTVINEPSRVLHEHPDLHTYDLDETDPIQMEPDHETEHFPQKSKTDFSLNVYRVHFDEKQQKLVMKTLHEVNNCDGVFIVVETNFEVLIE